MNADILILAAHIADVILVESQLKAEDASTVRRVYEVERDLGRFVGRHIDVFPLRYERNPPTTRREDGFTAFLGVVITERYTPPQEQDLITVPIDWVDERVDFVERVIYNPVQAARVQFNVEYTTHAWICDFAEVTTVYDYRYLKQHKVFWSEIEFGFTTLHVGEI